MSSLASCIKKAGKSLLPEDAEAIRRIHDDLVAAGVENAAEQAIDEHLAAISAERAALVAQIEAEGGSVPSGVVYARQQRLSDIARKLSITSVLEGTETLSLPDSKVTKAGKLKATVREIATALEARARAANRGRALTARTPRNKEILAETMALETEAAMGQTGHAGDWYSSVVQAAVNIVGELHPELKTDANARNLFMLGLAITSAGTNVGENAALGEQVYQHLKKHGEFPIMGSGQQGAGMRKAFAQANELIAKWGVNDFVKFLNTEFTVGELKVLGYEVSGENVDTNTHGSAVFGPKVGGGFFQNLMGNFNTLTMDRWFMRTWGRMTGELLPSGELSDTQAQTDAFVAALEKTDPKVLEMFGITKEQALANDAVLVDLVQKIHRYYAKTSSKHSKTYGEKTALNMAAKNLDLALHNPIISPRNGDERNWMREVSALAIEKLEERGLSVNAASMQALIWYPEKDLYINHGAGNAKAAPTDYEQEFAKIARERGVDESSIDAARSGQSVGREPGRVGVDRDDASVEGTAAPAFKGKGRTALIHREVTARAREQLPRHYGRRIPRGNERTLKGVGVSQVFNPSVKAKNAFTKGKLAIPKMMELTTSPEAAALFAKRITVSKENSAFGPAVFVYPEEQYQNMRLFLTEDGTAGFALNGNDIVSVFNTYGGPHNAAGQAMLRLAVEEGGRKLDAFDTILPMAYSLQGFKVISRLAWDESEKPAGWNKKQFNRWNNGEPDVVFMVYDRNHTGVYTGQYEGNYAANYSQALKAQDAAVEQLAERNKPDVRYRIDDEEQVAKNPESPISRINKLALVMDRIATLSNSQLTLAKLKETFSEGGIASVLASVPRRNIRDFLPEKLVPSLDKYLRLANRLDGRRNELVLEAELIARKWAKWTRKAGKREAGKLADLMHASTLAGVDPTQEYVPLKKAKNMNAMDVELDTLRREQYEILKEFLAKLDPGGVEIFNEVRDYYKDKRATLEETLMDRIDQSAADSKNRRVIQDMLRQKFESGRVSGPYFPLARFGSRWAAAKDENGEVVAFSRFESNDEYKEWRASWEEAGFRIDAGKRDMTEAKTVASIDPRFVQKVQELVSDTALQDEIWQMYLRSLPEMSMRKRFMHRKGRIGFAADALRSFANVSFHGAHQQAKLEYVHQLEDTLRNMHEEVRTIEQTDQGKDFEWAMPVYNEMLKRHQLAMAPRAGSLAANVTGLGFLWYLGFTPAAAAVNLSQLPLVALPVLAAEFNSLGATKELGIAMKTYAGAWRGSIESRLRGDEYKAFLEARRIGLFEKTQGHDLAGVTEAGGQHYGSLQHKTLLAGSLMFHKAEQFNREVTFLAAYRLARQRGMSHDDGVLLAEDLTWDSHFDYNANNRPRWMQGDLLRVLTLFKQYSLNMTYRMFRDANDALRAESVVDRRKARVRFTGMMMMAATMSGLTGLPMLMVESVKFVANTLFGDDDEFDAEDSFRAYLTDLYGAKMAELIMKGPVDALSGATLSNRVSLNELWMRDAGPYDQDKTFAERFFFETVGGPIVGQANATFEGLDQIKEGHTWRGLERILPKAARDAMRAMRLNAEGAMNMQTPREVLVPQEDITPADLIYQAVGFTPARLTLQYEQNEAYNRATQLVEDKKARAMDMYQLGAFNDDKKAMAEGMELITEFNSQYPYNAIDMRSINQSSMNRMRRSARSRAGVALEDNMSWIYDELGFTPPPIPISEENEE